MLNTFEYISSSSAIKRYNLNSFFCFFCETKFCSSMEPFPNQYTYLRNLHTYLCNSGYIFIYISCSEFVVRNVEKNANAFRIHVCIYIYDKYSNCNLAYYEAWSCSSLKVHIVIPLSSFCHIIDYALVTHWTTIFKRSFPV